MSDNNWNTWVITLENPGFLLPGKDPIPHDLDGPIIVRTQNTIPYSLQAGCAARVYA